MPTSGHPDYRSTHTSQPRQIPPHILERGLRFPDGLGSSGLDSDVSPSLATAFGARLAQPRSHEPFGLEPLEGSVYRGSPDSSSRPLTDLVDNRNRVGVLVSQPKDSQEDEKLEFTQISLCHTHLPLKS